MSALKIIIIKKYTEIQTETQWCLYCVSQSVLNKTLENSTMNLSMGFTFVLKMLLFQKT